MTKNKFIFTKIEARERNGFLREVTKLALVGSGGKPEEVNVEE